MATPTELFLKAVRGRAQMSRQRHIWRRGLRARASGAPTLRKIFHTPLDLKQRRAISLQRWTQCKGRATVRSAVAYIRVSTKRQGRSGLGLEAQQEALARFAEAEGFRFLQTFTETES